MSMFRVSRPAQTKMPGFSRWNPTSTQPQPSLQRTNPGVQTTNPGMGSVMSPPSQQCQRSQNAQLASSTPVSEPPMANPPEMVTPAPQPQGYGPSGPGMKAPTLAETMASKAASGQLAIQDALAARQAGDNALSEAILDALAGRGWSYMPPSRQAPMPMQTELPGPVNPVAGTIYDRPNFAYTPPPIDPAMQQPVTPAPPNIPQPPNRVVVPGVGRQPQLNRYADVDRVDPGSQNNQVARGTMRRRPGNGIFTGR